jgi:hypothetical protein
MEASNGDDERLLSRIHRVRCLSCGVAYAKPTGGGTVSTNPGCPECGYLGWLREDAAATPDASQRRSVADRLRRPTG